MKRASATSLAARIVRARAETLKHMRVVDYPAALPALDEIEYHLLNPSRPQAQFTPRMGGSRA